MADSHIPNAKATPDWRELPYPRTSFDHAINLTPVDDTKGLYTCFAPKDWCAIHDQRSTVHGGYISSLLIAGSRAYFRSHYKNLNQPDPVHLHVQFLEPAPQGPLHVSFMDVKVGPRQSVIQGEILSADRTKRYTLGIFTMGDLGKKQNPGISMDLDLIHTPNRERDCTRWTTGFFFFAVPPSSACRHYTTKGGPDPLWSPTVGRNKRDQWMKLDNEDNFQLEHLGLIADLIPCIPLNYEKNTLKGILKYDFVTVSMTFDFVSDPAGQQEWILNRTTMNRLQDGRFDMDVQMINDNGRLVATVRHQSLMFPHKRRGSTQPSL